MILLLLNFRLQLSEMEVVSWIYDVFLMFLGISSAEDGTHAF